MTIDADTVNPSWPDMLKSQQALVSILISQMVLNVLHDRAQAVGRLGVDAVELLVEQPASF